MIDVRLADLAVEIVRRQIAVVTDVGSALVGGSVVLALLVGLALWRLCVRANHEHATR